MHRRISLSRTVDLPELVELVVRSPSSFEKGFSVIAGSGEKKFPDEFRKPAETARSYLLGLDSADRPVFLCLSVEPSDETLLELLRVHLWQRNNPWVLPLLFGHGIDAGPSRARFAVAAVSLTRQFAETVQTFSNLPVELFELRVALVDDSEKYPAFCPAGLSRNEQPGPESLPAFLSTVEPEKLRNLAMRITGRIQKTIQGVSFTCRPGRVIVAVSGKDVGSLHGGKGFLEFSADGFGSGPIAVLEDDDADAVLARVEKMTGHDDPVSREKLLTPDEIRSIKGS